MTANVKLAYVVPTLNRPDDLGNLLDSLQAQTRLPAQIVIVDGGDEDNTVRHVVERYPELPLEYVREFPPSLARQRNAGMARVSDDVIAAGYLDDDLILEEDATERMNAFWCTAGADVGGAAFNIVNQPGVSSGFFNRLFLLNGRRPGAMLPSGWPSQIPAISQTVETDWLFGGATMWRREVIDTFDYDEWFVGHGYGEDVDFSFRVSRSWRLFVVANARVLHMTRPIRLSSQYTLGRQQVINRYYFIRKSGCFPRAAVAWAMFGQFIGNISASLIRLDSAGLRRFLGNVCGLSEVLRGRVDQITNYYK
jgi:glycosyltransferase involved in cell wall biosynthesis